MFTQYDVDTINTINDEEKKITKEGAYIHCDRCQDTGLIIYDWAGHNGNHEQRELPCECTLEEKEEDNQIF